MSSSPLVNAVKKLVALTPYRITRSATNRFQGIEHSLEQLRRLGYAPRLIVDGGAHLGSFAREARKLFPDAVIHLIEPQPPCRAALEALATERGFVFHPFALSLQPGTLQFSETAEPDTGAHIPWAKRSQGTVDVQATTLDELFAATVSPADRTLLKLDLQGHELMALRGGARLLPAVEVVLTEVSFFQQLREPTIPELIRFFDESGFDLFDVAALSGRTRDDRLRQGDLLFVRRGSPLSADTSWA